MKTQIFDEQELRIAEGIPMDIWKAGFIQGEPIVFNDKVIGWMSEEKDNDERK